MSPTLITLLLTLTLLSPLLAVDPDPFLDFCIPDPGPAAPLQLTHLSTYPCKSPSNLSAADFSFSGLRHASSNYLPTGFSGTFATPLVFPALHTLGVSIARADLTPSGGFNPPHYHPRATEVAMVLRGQAYAGFVDSGNRLFTKVLEEGDVWVNPKGMVHFLMNVGEGPATVVGFFNGENPGGVKIPEVVFGSGIKEELLERAFELSVEEIERLKKSFGSGSSSSSTEAVI